MRSKSIRLPLAAAALSLAMLTSCGAPGGAGSSVSSASSSGSGAQSAPAAVQVEPLTVQDFPCSTTEEFTALFQKMVQETPDQIYYHPYTGLFLKPNKETFRYVDLVTRRSTFSKGELVAFDVDAGSNLDASSDGTVMVNLVVRDADGKIVDSSSSVLVWKDMWEKNMFVGYFPRTPQTDGDYTLSIYIGNQLLDSAKFTVKS